MNNRSRVRKDPPVTPFRRISPRPARLSLRVVAGLGALALGWLAAPQGALAQGRLDARYEVTLAGIPVGKGAWTIEISDDQFSAAASGGTAGLLKAFSGGSGTSASQGRITAARSCLKPMSRPPPRRRNPRRCGWRWSTAM